MEGFVADSFRRCVPGEQTLGVKTGYAGRIRRELREQSTGESDVAVLLPACRPSGSYWLVARNETPDSAN